MQQEEGYSIKQTNKSKKMLSKLLAKNRVFVLENLRFVQGFYKCLEYTQKETIGKAKKWQKCQCKLQ